MKIEQENSLKPKKDGCSISNQQIKFFDKITNDIESLRVSLEALTGKVDARDEVFSTGDLSAINASIGKDLTTENLYVNGLTSLQGDTQANNLTVNGVLSVLNELSAKLLRIEELFANKAHINEADIKSAIIDILRIRETLIRFDTNQEIISFPSENITQLGDIANSIILAGLERPKWNEFPIALLSDVTEGITPIYKGIVNTVEDLPTKADVGDFYIINSVTEKKVTGIGKALFNGEKFDISIFYELLNYYNKDEITKLFDDELIDDLHRETDIIEGKTPVQKVRAGCVDTEGNLLATTDDAFMLYGPEGMDNIKPNTSLDDLLICSQYSADNELANTILDKPEGEMGAFDIAVGYFSGNKNDVWQLYVGKTTQKMYFRIADNKSFSNWNNILYPTDISGVVVKRAEQADSLKVGATIGDSEVASINDFFTNSFALNNIPLKANDNIDDLPLGTYATVDFSIFSQIKGNKPFDNPFKLFIFKGGKETDNSQQQLAIEWTSERIAIRHSNGKSWTEWAQIAILDNNGNVDKATQLTTQEKEIDSFDLPNNFGNKVVKYNGSTTEAPVPTSNGQAMTFSKGGSEQAVIAFDNNKNDMYFKTQFGDWKEWKKTASLDKDGYVKKAKSADIATNLKANAKIGNDLVANVRDVLYGSTAFFGSTYDKIGYYKLDITTKKEYARLLINLQGSECVLISTDSNNETYLYVNASALRLTRGYGKLLGVKYKKIKSSNITALYLKIAPYTPYGVCFLSGIEKGANKDITESEYNAVKNEIPIKENATTDILLDLFGNSWTSVDTIITENNIDTALTIGRYRVVGKKTNAPGSWDRWLLDVIEWDGTPNLIQIGTNVTGRRAYRRKAGSDKWTSWEFNATTDGSVTKLADNATMTIAGDTDDSVMNKKATKALLGNQKTFRFENGTLFIDDYVEPVALMAHPVMTLEEPVNMDEDIMTLENKDGDNNELNI